MDTSKERPNIPLGTPLAAGAILKGPIRHPTLSLDPGVLKSLDGFDEHGGYINCAVEAFALAHKNIGDVIAARDAVNKNASWSEDRKLLKLDTFASAKQEQATKAMDAAMTRLESGIKALDTALTQPLEQQAGLGSVNEEIRRHAKSLSNEQRGKFLAEALDKGDLKTVAAIAGAPHYLSGLTDLAHSNLVRQYREATSPVEVQRLSLMKRALHIVESRGALVITQVIEALGHGKDVWQKIERARKTHSAAESALKLA